MFPILFVCLCVFGCFACAIAREVQIDEIIQEERMKKQPLPVQGIGAMPGETLSALPSAPVAVTPAPAPASAPVLLVVPTQLSLELRMPGLPSVAASTAPTIDSLPMAEFDVAHTSYDDLEPLIPHQETHWVH